MVATAQKISKAELQEYVRLREEKKKLETQARNLGKAIDLIGERCEAELQAAGKDSIKRFGFQLSYVNGRATVGWKDEFIRVAGPEEANRLQQEATPTKKLEVTLIDAGE